VSLPIWLVWPSHRLRRRVWESIDDRPASRGRALRALPVPCAAGQTDAWGWKPAGGFHDVIAQIYCRALPRTPSPTPTATPTVTSPATPTATSAAASCRCVNRSDEEGTRSPRHEAPYLPCRHHQRCWPLPQLPAAMERSLKHTGKRIATAWIMVWDGAQRTC
jgi:hypothetical protein